MSRQRSLDRVRPDDMIHLDNDREPAPAQVGAIMMLASHPPVSLSDFQDAMSRRLTYLPRFRQRLWRTPVGCGRPVWIDDQHYDIRRHISEMTCPDPGDQRALLDIAADKTTTPLPLDAPLWSATVVRGVNGSPVAVILVIHHALADGVGAMGALAYLMDREDTNITGDTDVATLSGGRPTVPELLWDTWVGRLRDLGAACSQIPRLVWACAELRVLRVRRARRCSLNQPTGPRRRLSVARARLDDVKDAGKFFGGTVNDVAVAAMSAAVGRLLATRGDALDSVVIGMLVSGRSPQVQLGDLGNQVGVARIVAPTSGPVSTRLGRITRMTTEVRHRRIRGASAMLIVPVFRLLAACHLFSWFMNHQRRIHVFATNIRGPEWPTRLCGVEVTDMIPISGTWGNVPVAFAVMSYAGQLTLTLVADPDACPDHVLLGALLQEELDSLLASHRE